MRFKVPPSIAIAAILAAVLGCEAKKGVSLSSVTMADLTPAASLPDRAILNLAQTEIPVELKSELKEDTFVVELSAFGELIESERYEVKSDSFALLECLDETYSPAMPLLKGEMVAKAPWKWKGKVISTIGSRLADAEIFIQPVPQKSGTPTWEVTANLNLDAGSQQRAKRVLTFVFMPEKGLISREFGMGSTRTVAIEASKSEE